MAVGSTVSVIIRKQGLLPRTKKSDTACCVEAEKMLIEMMLFDIAPQQLMLDYL